MRTLAAFSLAALVGCGGNNPTPPTPDMAVPVVDMAMNQNMVDMANGGTCAPDPMTDSQPCGNGCPQGSGTIPVQDQNGQCKCYYACTPMVANSCPCGRRCQGLCTPTDGGCVDNGMGACLHANGGGERCADAMGKPVGFGGICQDGTLCVREGQTMNAYCMYKCTKQADCPRGTTCLMLNNGGSACIMNSSEMGSALGMMCMVGDICAIGSLCDGMSCAVQCDGPMDMTTCGAMKCTALADMTNMKVAGYVCK